MMNYRMLGYLLGVILLIEASLLSIPLVFAAVFGESVLPFLFTMAIILAISLPLVFQKPKNTVFYAKEGFVCVAASWILMSLFGALPFVFSGAIPNYINAFFETVSGFTTTGATILSEIESLPKGILFWRSLTHWIGGMGVLMFMLAILPRDNGRAIHLMRAEVPGPQKGKLVPKIRETAMILYGIYIVLTIAETIALLFTGMSFYDSLVNSLATAGTGGFSVMNQSIESYANPAAEWVIAIFMLIFGVNFNMYFLILIGKIRDIFKSEELRLYFALCTFSTVLITLNAGVSLRKAFFQVTSIMSTTGFSTANFDAWPSLSKSVIVLLMIVGACAGSTAGGLKISRVLILIKSFFREIKHMLKPRSVNVVRLDKETVSEETVKSTTNYLSIYLILMIFSTILISIDGFDLETNLTATISCINNIGPGLSLVGPYSNFAGFSFFSKILLSLDMLVGRLEIMPMIILFSPAAWKRN